MSTFFFVGMLFLGLLFMSTSSIIDLALRIYNRLTPMSDRPVNLLGFFGLVSIAGYASGATLFFLGILCLVLGATVSF